MTITQLSEHLSTNWSAPVKGSLGIFILKLDGTTVPLTVAEGQIVEWQTSRSRRNNKKTINQSISQSTKQTTFRPLQLARAAGGQQRGRGERAAGGQHRGLHAGAAGAGAVSGAAGTTTKQNNNLSIQSTIHSNTHSGSQGA